MDSACVFCPLAGGSSRAAKRPATAAARQAVSSLGLQAPKPQPPPVAGDISDEQVGVVHGWHWSRMCV